jgi:magnesium-transporting ATPase (P-type)
VQPTQVLWINLVVAVSLALPLAFEAKEPDVMRRPPRDPKAPDLDRALIARTLLVGLLMALGGVGLFLFGYAAGTGRGQPTGVALAEAQTMAVTSVILFQVFYLMNCRSLRGSVLDIGLFSNKWVYVGIGAILLLQLGFVYLPFMNALFGSAPLGAGSWFLSFLIALIVLPVVGAEKMWRKRVHRRKLGG